MQQQLTPAKLTLDKSIDYGEICGEYEPLPEAKFEQFGHLFDSQGNDLTPEKPVVVPKARPGTAAAKDAELAVQKLKIRELERKLSELSGTPAPKEVPAKQAETASTGGGALDLDAWEFMREPGDPEAKKYRWVDVQAEVFNRTGKMPKSKEEAKSLIEAGK